MSKLKRIFLTYTKQHKIKPKVYSGRCSGFGHPIKILAKRDSSHHMNKDGFHPADIDKYSYNSDAIRGREQELIEYYGGAKSEGGTSANAINTISKRNKKRKKYLDACKRAFGTLKKS